MEKWSINLVYLQIDPKISSIDKSNAVDFEGFSVYDDLTSRT